MRFPLAFTSVWNVVSSVHVLLAFPSTTPMSKFHYLEVIAITAQLDREDKRESGPFVVAAAVRNIDARGGW